MTSAAFKFGGFDRPVPGRERRPAASRPMPASPAADQTAQAAGWSLLRRVSARLSNRLHTPGLFAKVIGSPVSTSTCPAAAPLRATCSARASGNSACWTSATNPPRSKV